VKSITLGACFICRAFAMASVFLCLILSSPPVLSSEYSARVSHVDIDADTEQFNLNVDVEYRLSPIAKQALQKGIALTWLIAIKLQEQGRLWNTTIEEGEINYTIKNHALLDLYSVKSNGVNDMFSTLSAALNSISKIRQIPIISKDLIEPDETYQLAIKVIFDREALPVPLRPISYFDSQWALSSEWTRWPLPK
jgi:hypothetical protein